MSANPIAKRVSSLLFPSVFEEFNAVCVRAKSLNMAQGFPDWQTPQFLKQSLVEVMATQEDQYARSGGHIPYIKAIAKEYTKKFGREINEMTEISVSNGATGVLSNIFAGLVNPGEEVMMFEPVFEYYFRQVQLFEGVPVALPLTPPTQKSDDWGYDFETIEKKITNKTKLLIINTPHNPTGKITTDAEIKRFCEIAKKWPNLIIVADETFSCTGWRAGFAIGPENLIKTLNTCQNWMNFCISRPVQVAFAKAMEKVDQPYEGSKSYYEFLPKLFESRRTRLMEILNKSPFKYRTFKPDGGYFAICDITEEIPRIPTKYFYAEGKNNNTAPVGDWKKLENPAFPPDRAFCRYLSFDHGVTPLPLSPFYINSNDIPMSKWRGTTYVRFAMCKNDDTLNKLEKLLCKSL